MSKRCDGYNRQSVKQEVRRQLIDLQAQKEDREWEEFALSESLDGFWDRLFGVETPEAARFYGSFRGSLYGT